MDDIDRKLLDRLQGEFPLVSRPFAEIASSLALDEGEVLRRVRRLSAEGYIRRLGPIIDVRRAGGASTLAAAAVPPERLAEAGKLVGEMDCVSHCYHREGANAPLPFNLWFTVSAPTQEVLDARIESVSARIGLTVHAMPVRREFKIGVRFRLDGE